MSTPDVSVIVPVYNTMPYLAECLDSLLAQTIGPERLQVVAVDDGSTDGGAELLDDYARRHPGTVLVEHQPNSGGPAGPCNRGLELATGRYVFFLGADDHLGEEALARLVDAADRWDSDVVFGTMVGVNGRYVHQAMYAETRESVGFCDSDLAFAIANTKLFRRSLVEEHGLRFRTDLRIGSDQPFTIEAMVRARKVSVLGDYTYYYAVRRDDASNISYASTWRQRVRDIGVVMDHVAGVVEPGPLRDAILRRHFAWELSKLLKADFLELPDEERAELAAGVGALCEAYLDGGVDDSLWSTARVRLRLAQARDLDRLAEVIAFQRDHHSPLVQRGDRLFGWVPGFGDVPVEWCRMGREGSWDRLLRGFEVASVELADGVLLLGGTVPLLDDDGAGAAITWCEAGGHDRLPLVRRYPRGECPAAVAADVALAPHDEPGAGSRWSARVPLTDLLASDAATGRRWAPQLRLDVGAHTYELGLRLPDVQARTRAQHEGRPVRVAARSDERDVVYLRRRFLDDDPDAAPSGRATSRR